MSSKRELLEYISNYDVKIDFLISSFINIADRLDDNFTSQELVNSIEMEIKSICLQKDNEDQKNYDKYNVLNNLIENIGKLITKFSSKDELKAIIDNGGLFGIVNGAISDFVKVDSFNGDYVPSIISTVNYWSDKLLVCKIEGLDAKFSVFGFESSKVNDYIYQRRSPKTIEEINLFRTTLAESIKNEILLNGSCVIDVDYFANPILRDAGSKIGLNQVSYLDSSKTFTETTLEQFVKHENVAEFGGNEEEIKFSK